MRDKNPLLYIKYLCKTTGADELAQNIKGSASSRLIAPAHKHGLFCATTGHFRAQRVKTCPKTVHRTLFHLFCATYGLQNCAQTGARPRNGTLSRLARQNVSEKRSPNVFPNCRYYSPRTAGLIFIFCTNSSALFDNPY